MPLNEQEQSLAKDASFGDDIMKQREAAIALEDIRYDDPPEDTNEWTPYEGPVEKVAEPEGEWTPYKDPDSFDKIVDPEVRDWLPNEIRVGFGDYTFKTPWTFSDDASAFWVTFGEAMTYIPRGIKQIAGIDKEEMQQASASVARLYEDEELKGNALAGTILGTLAEPLGFMIPGGKATSGTKAIAKGFGIGATYGGLGYVEEGQTRLGNTLLGGTVGATINRGFHGARNYFAGKASQKARKDLELLEKYWAEEMVKAPNAAAEANAAREMPRLFPSPDVYARKAMKRMPENFSLIKSKDIGGRILNPPRNLEEAQYIINSYGLDKTQGKVSKLVDRAIGITSTRIGNIAESVKGMVRKYDYAIKQDNHNYLERVSPFLTRYSKIPNKQKLAMDKALLEGDFELVRVEMRKQGQDAVNDFDSFNATMQELGLRSKEAGLIKDLVNNYVPRYIRDPEAYMKAIGKEDRVFRGALDAALSKAEKKVQARGQKLSTEAKSQIMHRTIFGSRSTKAPRSSFTYERKLKTIPDYLVKEYSSPEEAVHSYIRNTVSDIYKRDFFGKSAKKIKLDDGFHLLDIDASATKFVEDNLMHLSAGQRKELVGLLSSRFGHGEKSPMGWLQDVKNVTYAALLGNPIAAATQLGDLGVSIYINGFRNTMSGLVKSVRVPFTEKTFTKKKITVRDWGVLDQLAEEFATTRQSARWLNRSFNYSGFQYVDRLGKDTFVNAAYSRLKQMPRAKFMRKYAEELGTDADKTFDELLKGDMTPRVKALLFSKLADVQPISPSEVPQAYLNNPNGRVMYMFKTFMLKQVDVIRQTAFKEFGKGNYGLGMKNLMSYGIIMGSAGMGSQDVKSLMLGKDISHDDIPVEIGMNLFKTFGWSSYALDQIKQGKYYKTATDQVLPPFEIFDKAVAGDPRVVPGVGQIWYYWFGGGIEEYAAKQRKKKLDSTLAPLKEARKDIKELLGER